MIEAIRADSSTIFYLIITFAGAYVLFSKYIVHRFGNRDRLKEIQKEMGEINKRYKDALKSKEDNRIKKAEKEQARIWPMMSESMRYQFMPLLVLFPIIILFSDLLRKTFPAFAIILPFDLPIIMQNWEHFPNWRNMFGSYGFFWVSVVFISMFSELSMAVYKKVRGKS
ncbi:MAG: EMC3/TMCO1 family protein [Candidatus Micrarchaeota archaeon]